MSLPEQVGGDVCSRAATSGSGRSTLIRWLEPASARSVIRPFVHSDAEHTRLYLRLTRTLVQLWDDPDSRERRAEMARALLFSRLGFGSSNPCLRQR